MAPAAGVRVCLNASLSGAKNLAAHDVEKTVAFGAASYSNPAAYCTWLPRRSPLASATASDADAHATAPLAPTLACGRNRALSTGRDERQHRARHAQPAKALGRTGRKPQRGHHGQPAGIRLTAAERIKPVLGQAGDVAESPRPERFPCAYVRMSPRAVARARSSHSL